MAALRIYPSDVPEKWPIGKDKPSVQYTREPDDTYYWQRRKAAEKLHTDESNLEDEPDEEPADWNPHVAKDN